ncbi:hypothetical protein DSM106972_047880 [Dulcicalothrix desertica PCC 7102]|uniref:Uncharacterized protein n=1 Tax=Dulcicalothrix desertica PCC 7102 TaxID=232991 RepID=A0A3S1CI03_9CYAN|nr:hypothetical protein [Dulcicalothrix desertica]RUT03874.1 hypothetical protein DSM106972_047880 [Dulcicalothrix desertica PCC 7102]TWH43715.1 hypothetical protein CAL7102_07459 [Dulcicalothrix desertica PCC 7102]
MNTTISRPENCTCSNEQLLALVQEYTKLSKLIKPCDEDIDRITVILELAQYDPELSSLIDKADDLIADELGLCIDS